MRVFALESAVERVGGELVFDIGELLSIFPSDKEICEIIHEYYELCPTYFTSHITLILWHSIQKKNQQNYNNAQV
jgi:hypothetical protein